MRPHASVLGAVAALLLAPGPGSAQPNCKKGIPCGNSCISASKVCRIGQAPAPDTAKPAPRSPAPTAAAAVSTDSSWVASFADGVFFKAECPAALDLAPANRRYFRSEQLAAAAGYRRSKVPGC